MRNPSPVSVRYVDASEKWVVDVLGKTISRHRSRPAARRAAAEWRGLLYAWRDQGAAKRYGKTITDADLDRLAERIRGQASLATAGVLYLDEARLRSVVGAYRTDGLPAGVAYRTKKGIE
jgi:hypothetical protein